MTEKWCLGQTSPKKVVHRRSCHHARADYPWARQFATVWDLAVELVNSGGHRWHRACQVCSGDLDDAIRAARDGALESTRSDLLRAAIGHVTGTHSDETARAGDA